MPKILPFTDEEYREWKEKLEAGYGQPRPGVSPDQVEGELASIPRAIRYSYLYKKHIGKARSEECQ